MTGPTHLRMPRVGWLGLAGVGWAGAGWRTGVADRGVRAQAYDRARALRVAGGRLGDGPPFEGGPHHQLLVVVRRLQAAVVAQMQLPVVAVCVDHALLELGELCRVLRVRAQQAGQRGLKGAQPEVIRAI